MCNVCQVIVNACVVVYVLFLRVFRNDNILQVYNVNFVIKCVSKTTGSFPPRAKSP